MVIIKVVATMAIVMATIVITMIAILMALIASCVLRTLHSETA